MSKLTSEFINSCAGELGSKRLKLDLPWVDVLCPVKFPELKLPSPDWVDVPTQSIAVSSSSSCKPDGPFPFRHARAKLADVSWAGSEDKKLHVALQCWKVIISDSSFHTKLGRTLISAIEQGKGDDDISDIVVVFANKSTSTLNSRAASLLAFGRWKKSIFVGEKCGIFPITEEMAYDYLCDLRKNHSAPSKRKRLLEAVGFSKGLVGAEVDEVLNSARVKGVAHGGIVTIQKKKVPFTVEQLISLENLATFSDGQVAIFAGYVCFLVHCRLRWSDGQHCINEPTLDITNGRGFIEASLYHHKTAKKRRMQMLRLLPVAGVLPGVSGNNWAHQWLEKRKAAGLTASMVRPMMPAPVKGGQWSPLTSSEAAVWLREILSPWVQGSLKDVATHSAKTTVLAWLSKATVPISLKRLAGYHAKPGDKSALEYSRDAAAPVLHQIEAVYIAIKAGRFLPDAARSRRWVGCDSLHSAVFAAAGCASSGGTAQDEFVRHVEQSVLQKETSGNDFDDLDSEINAVSELVDIAVARSKVDLGWDDNTTLQELPPSEFVPPPRDEDVEVSSESGVDCNSSSPSFDSDSSSEDVARRVDFDGEANSRNLVAPSDLSRRKCYMHIKSGKLHFVERTVGDDRFFKCGRLLTENYVRLDPTPSFDAHGCLTCFNYRDGPEQGMESE